ncbi:MAG: DNA repair protein RadA [Vampirovibrionales bacterium]|nr:DNA repair protein RadA [Vampirovibrionales bacterium]
MAKLKSTRYECEHCGAQSATQLGRCPGCQAWDSFIAVPEPAKNDASQMTQKFKLGKPGLMGASLARFEGHLERGLSVAADEQLAQKLISLAQVQQAEQPRLGTGFTEIDRVLGGGLVPGSYLLVGGDPGIGKSTLMLQLAGTLSQRGQSVLYIAGEESTHQIKGRACRLGFGDADVTLLAETDMAQILQAIQHKQPDLVIIDSIQAVFDADIANTPGSMAQVKACATQLLPVAKTLGITTILVGHVTKDGAVAGPKLLEHLVDTVLYFEGERYKDLRLLRTIKNRFGATHELGVFQMAAGGLEEVNNPSLLFLGGASPDAAQNTQPHLMPGSVAVCTMEGTRPLIVEIQALVGQTQYATPRRVANGFPLARLHQIAAVLERRIGVDLSRQDLFVNVVGGLDIDEPAADLAVALALVASWRDLALPAGTVVCGEVGLTGEIRAVRAASQRVAEAGKIGFKRVILPAGQARDVLDEAGAITGIGVKTLPEALIACQLAPKN